MVEVRSLNAPPSPLIPPPLPLPPYTHFLPHISPFSLLHPSVYSRLPSLYPLISINRQLLFVIAGLHHTTNSIICNSFPSLNPQTRKDVERYTRRKRPITILEIPCHPVPILSISGSSNCQCSHFKSVLPQHQSGKDIVPQCGPTVSGVNIHFIRKPATTASP